VPASPGPAAREEAWLTPGRVSPEDVLTSEISKLSWSQLQILAASLIDELPPDERPINSTTVTEIGARPSALPLDRHDCRGTPIADERPTRLRARLARTRARNLFR
jgi:hypothetical protein